MLQNAQLLPQGLSAEPKSNPQSYTIPWNSFAYTVTTSGSRGTFMHYALCVAPRDWPYAAGKRLACFELSMDQPSSITDINGRKHFLLERVMGARVRVDLWWGG
jgi:hypothetical protein